MAITRRLASFPNSRIKPRDARSGGDAEEVIVPAGPATIVQVVASNANRTDLTIRNTSSLDTVFYGYTNNAAGTVFDLPPGAAKDIPGTQTVYVRNETLNPVTIDIDEGEG